MRAKLALLSLLTLGGSLLGCAAEDSPALILSSFHGLSAEEDACVHAAEPSSRGMFDLGIAGELGLPFTVYVHLENALMSNEGASPGQLNTHKVEVEKIHVSFSGDEWETLPEPVEINVAGVLIDSGGEYYTPVTVIPASISEELMIHHPHGRAKPATVELRVHATGRTFDGTDVVSNKLSFAVDSCLGCFEAMCWGGALVPLCNLAMAQSDGVECVLFDDTPGDGGDDTGGTGGAGGDDLGGGDDTEGAGGTGGHDGEAGAGGAGGGEGSPL